MNPYLEQPELWSEFLSRMIVAIEVVSSEDWQWLQAFVGGH